jgi:hypothetical protein
MRAQRGASAVAAVIAALTGASATATEPASGAPLAGSYRYVGGDAEVKAMYASVEGVVKKMSFIVRGIARKRLRKPNLPSPELDLLIGPTSITITRTGQGSVVAPRSGAPGKWRSSDGAFTVRCVLKGRALIQTIDGKDSHSTNRYTLDEDGATLRVQTRIASSRLPGPVVFAMTYRRK